MRNPAIKDLVVRLTNDDGHTIALADIDGDKHYQIYFWHLFYIFVMDIFVWRRWFFISNHFQFLKTARKGGEFFLEYFNGRPED